MFCNCKNIFSQAWVTAECSETNKNKVNMGNSVRNEQTGIKYHRIPFHRKCKDRTKPKKHKSSLMNIHRTGILSERSKENIAHPLARDNTHCDGSKSFNNVQWPQLKSPSKCKKGHGDTKPELVSTETQTDIFNLAKIYPLWYAQEIVTQINDVSLLRQNRITQATQTEDMSGTNDKHSESLAHLSGILTLAQIHKTYADVLQQENGRSEQGTKPMTTEASTELKTFFKLKDTKRHCMHKHLNKSLEASLQNVEIHNQLESNVTHSTLADITEIYLSRNDQAGDPQNFKNLLLMLTRQNRGLKINLLHENQPGLLYVLSSPKPKAREASLYDVSASARNYFILHSDNCMLNCTTVNQLMYGYNFQEGSQQQIKQYNQSLQTNNIPIFTIIDNELQELGCRKLKRTVSRHYQEIYRSEDQRFQQNRDLNKASTERAQINENLQYFYMNMMVTDAGERQSALQENDINLHPESIATEGLDPICAFYLALELWGGNKPRMPYTKVLGPNSLQNKFSGWPCRESTYGEEDECSVPKWLIVPLQKEHQFLLDTVNEEQSNVCSVYYESQSCKRSRYTVEIQNNDFR